MTWQGLGEGLELGISYGLGTGGALMVGHRRSVRSTAVACPSTASRAVSCDSVRSDPCA